MPKVSKILPVKFPLFLFLTLPWNFQNTWNTDVLAYILQLCFNISKYTLAVPGRECTHCYIRLCHSIHAWHAQTCLTQSQTCDNLERRPMLYCTAGNVYCRSHFHGWIEGESPGGNIPDIWLWQHLVNQMCRDMEFAFAQGWFHIKSPRKTWYFFGIFDQKKSKVFDILVIKTFF